MLRQSRSPRSRPWTSTSAVAMLVAMGMLCTSHRRSRVISLGSLGLALIGSRKKMSRSISLQAMRAAICWPPPCLPDKNRLTGSPVASAISLPVVPVATSWFWLRMRQYAVQNCTISSFLESCAISAIVIPIHLLCSLRLKSIPTAIDYATIPIIMLPHFSRNGKRLLYKTFNFSRIRLFLLPTQRRACRQAALTPAAGPPGRGSCRWTARRNRR